MADFTSRFNELTARHPGSDTDLGAALGVSKQTISAWKSGKRSPKTPAVRSIAEYFGVGIPWLMGITDDEQAGMQPAAPLAPADPRETELLGLYRGLNDNGQHTLLKYAHYLDADPDMKRGTTSENETA